MLSAEYAIDLVQTYLKKLGIKDTPEDPQFILDIMNEKLKEFLGETFSISSHAEITTEADTVEYTLPSNVYAVTQVDLDEYKITSKITEREVKPIAGDAV